MRESHRVASTGRYKKRGRGGEDDGDRCVALKERPNVRGLHLRGLFIRLGLRRGLPLGERAMSSATDSGREGSNTGRDAPERIVRAPR